VERITVFAVLSGMAIRVNLDLMMVRRKMSLTELSSRVRISMTNLSLLKTGKVKGMRFATLESICRELECQPGDILEYVPEAISATQPMDK
jgi:putative transcriptional regulator